MNITDLSCTFNGTAFGSGTPFRIANIVGLRAVPAMRADDVDKARADGQWPGVMPMGARTVVVTFDLADISATAFEDDMDALAGALIPTFDPANIGPLAFSLSSWDDPRQLNCRVDVGDVPIDLQYAAGLTDEFDVSFLAPDPLIYDSVVQTLTAGLPISDPTASFPSSFPFGFGAGTSGGAFTATNEGNWQSAPIITFAGPLTNPILYNLTTGLYIGCNITLGSSDTLVLDVANHAVTLDGTADRYSAFMVGGRWVTVVPGANDLYFSSGDLPGAGGTCEVQFSSAWAWV